MTNDESTEKEKSLPWSLVAAGLVVGVIVALGILLSVRAVMSDDDVDGTASSASSSSPASSPSAEGGDSVCGLPGHETSGEVNKAPKAQWRLVGTMAAPEVEKVGPGKIEDDGFGYCFAHTPEGAVLSAANIFPLTATHDMQAKAYDKLLVPGPGRDVLMKAAKDGTAEEVPSSERLQIAAFRLTRYTGAEANLDLVSKSGGRYFSTPFQLQWSGGDWKAVANDDGSMPGQTKEVPDLSGYIAWSGA